MAPQDTAMEPRPNPRWPRGTCFAWELLRGCRKGSMLYGTGPLLCIEVEEPGGPHESGGIWRAVSAGAAVGVAEAEPVSWAGAPYR
jgi:hypothetical protein